MSMQTTETASATPTQMPRLARTGLWSWPLGLLLVALAVVVATYWETFVSMASTWNRSSTYSHCFLVLPASLYLIWTRRRQTAELAPQPDLRVAFLLLIPSFAWLLGELAAVLPVKQFSSVAVVVVLVWAMVGTRVFRTLLFPLLLLFFLVPVGEGLVPALQDFTASFAVKALELTGVPVVLEGRILEVPTGKWEVAEACSGLRYLVSSVTLGFVFAWVAYRSWRRRAALVVVSVVVPILGNGVRAYLLVLAGHLTGNRMGTGPDHILYGWVFFAVLMLGTFALGWRWREKGVDQAPSQASFGEETIGRRPASLRKLVLATATATAVAVALPVWADIWLGPASPAFVRAPQALVVSSPWVQGQEAFGGWKPSFADADTEFTQTYVRDGQRVQVYIAYYADVQSGRKLISSTNTLFDRARWHRVGGGRASANVSGQLLEVEETRIQSAEANRVLWSWYWVGDRFTTSPYLAKLRLAWSQLSGGLQASAAIVISAEYVANQGEATEAIRDFLLHISWQQSLRQFGSEPAK